MRNLKDEEIRDKLKSWIEQEKGTSATITFEQYLDMCIKIHSVSKEEGRKQLADEIMPMINKNNIGEVPRAIVLDEIKQKLQKEDEK